MKKLFIVSATVLLFACNSSDKTNNTSNAEPAKSDQATTKMNDVPATPVSHSTNITVEGKEIGLSGSLLVQKNKDKLQAGSDYLVMLTSSGGSNKESLVLNFLLALKTGTYPVVGFSFNRGADPNAELYGSLLGGKPKLTNYKVNITECKDLGSNNLGGHKWSISGTFDELVIPAMGIMLMDKTKNHPKEIKIEKGSFSNLTFDDNWEEMMNKAMDQMKK